LDRKLAIPTVDDIGASHDRDKKHHGPQRMPHEAAMGYLFCGVVWGNWINPHENKTCQASLDDTP